ncbi:bile acid:sodium symporter [Hyphomonas johnsonii MHS-2]|uniref:Bile acid:sodium symporter n=2 Tax=Hyphomonas johnsonii TaxID=81031 RepID=A0A059FRT2_9PROT|nr:bile acid:sodium symporter [Hyphomonas johnsonii MHS-2]
MKARIIAAALRIDRFLLLLVATVVIASILPARGDFADIASLVSDLAIALLFFLHGAKLSRQAIMAGIRAWPVHLLVLLATFVMFPIFGVVARQVADIWLDPNIGAGILLLCLMPSTVQSSIAFTSIAGGNVPAAVCSASASSTIGVFLTPLLVAMLMSGSGSGGLSLDSIYAIALQLLLPFAVGHLARPLLVRFLDRYKALVTKVDRGAILSVVYVAFSAAVVEGLWSRYAPSDLLWTLLICTVILGLALTTTTTVARLLGLKKEDEITVVFCGSKKSLASGVPIASALFPAAMVGPLILPLMLFHQIQLMACSVIAQRYATARAEAEAEPPASA